MRPSDVQRVLQKWLARPVYALTVTPGERGPYEAAAGARASLRQKPPGASHPIDITAYIGFWGDVRIELIQQHNPEETLYSTWPDEGSLHHILCLAPDFEKAGELLSQQGATLAQEGAVPDLMRFQYWDLGRNGPYIELAKRDSANASRVNWIEAARNWDGSDPLRRLSIEDYAGTRPPAQ